MRLRRQPSQARQRRLRVGSQPSQQLTSAYSYHGRRSEQELNTGRQLDRESRGEKPSLLRFWLQRFGLIFLLLAAVASAINVLELSDKPEVRFTTTATSSTHSLVEYQMAAQHLLANSIWNRNKLTVDTGNISRQLLKQFPELASASVTLPLLTHRPIIYVQPAQPALILANSNGAFLIDTTGRAVLAASSPTGLNQPKLPVLTDQSGLHIRVGQPALTADNVSFIQAVVTELASRHFTASALTLPPAASELDVHLAGQTYFIKFNLQTNDARQQAGTFLATINQLQQQHTTPSQYVDVRVDGRAYYK